VMRDTTERPEGIAAGTVKLVGAESAAIIRETMRLLDDPAAYRAMSEATNPYGDGHATPRILAAIRHYFETASTIAPIASIAASPVAVSAN
jgi:UDP-N-acetylglucosamine 2-epimerase (non-hydrolysing)